MSSETILRPRIVDLSKEDLSPGSASWISACSAIREALEDYGFLEVVYNKPSQEVRNTTFSALEELFNLPKETKMKNFNEKLAHGYFCKPKLHEGLGIDEGTKKEECLKFTNLMWPQGNDHFCETIHSFSKIMHELEQLVVRMLFESYGLEKYYDSHVKSTTHLLRLLRYERPEGEDCIGLPGHTDKSFLTILYQNHVNGLRVRTGDGHWINFDPSTTSSFAIFAGDLCTAWSNGRIRANYHEAAVPIGEDVRYALVLFPFITGLVQAPKELIDEQHPLQYKPFEYLGLINFYRDTVLRIDPNKADSEVLKVYCGV